MSAVDEARGDDRFKQSSQIAELSRKASIVFKEWTSLAENKIIVQEYSKKICQELSNATICLKTAKKLSAGKQKMWSPFHQIRLTPNFRAKWQQLLCHNMDADPHYLFQYHTDVIFRKMITSYTEY